VQVPSTAFFSPDPATALLSRDCCLCSGLSGCSLRSWTASISCERDQPSGVLLFLHSPALIGRKHCRLGQGMSVPRGTLELSHDTQPMPWAFRMTKTDVWWRGRRHQARSTFRTEDEVTGSPTLRQAKSMALDLMCRVPEIVSEAEMS
jgi:hypothetical protein